MDVPDAAQELVRRRPLEQVAGGAGGERGEDQVGVLVDRQHHDLHRRQQRPQPPHALDAAHARQVDVHQHDVGADGGQLGDRALAALVLADAREPIGAVDQPGEAGADARVVLDDRDADRPGLPGGGGLGMRGSVRPALRPGESPVVVTLVTGQRHLELDARAPAGLARDRAAAADGCQPLAQVAEAASGRRPIGLLAPARRHPA